jgi:hypothetical protein
VNLDWREKSQRQRECGALGLAIILFAVVCFVLFFYASN